MAARKDDLYQGLYDRGLSCSEIAAEAGVSTSAVAQWLRRRGLPARGAGNLPAAARPALPDGEDVREAPGHPGYLVSRAGAVYSARTDPPREMARRATRNGPRVCLSAAGRLRDRYVAALVLEAWAGPRPDGGVVRHKDGDRGNCRAENLEWAFGNARIDPAELIPAWQRAATIKEAAERLGSTYGAVRQAAARLIKLGVPLKKLTPGRLTEADVAELSRLAEECLEDIDDA
jgi:hypothetical protein